MSLYKLFLLFLKIGAILLGGGYVILPIMTDEFITKRKLLTHDELMNFFALSQSLPGLIAINISLFVGYKLRGKCGAITSVIGIIFVPFWCIVLLGSVLSVLADNYVVQGAFKGVSVAVIVLITMNIREIWRNTKKDAFFYLIFVFSLCSMLVFNLSPILTILIFAILGVITKKIIQLIKEKQPKCEEDSQK